MLTSSCERPSFAWDSDYYFNKETTDGNGTLSFTIDNLKINQQNSGGFLSPLYRWAKYNIDEETSVATIFAALISKGYYINTMPFPEITFTFSSDLLESGAEFTEVETEFWYRYREAEYQLVDVSETKIRIRKWSPDEHILAGNFTMTGQYTDSLGVVHPFAVKNGLFDLKESDKLFVEIQ